MAAIPRPEGAPASMSLSSAVPADGRPDCYAHTTRKWCTDRPNIHAVPLIRPRPSQLFWRCPVSNRFGFARPALSNGTITVIAAPAGGQRVDLRALACEPVAFMSLWVSQADPAILAVPGVVAVPSTTRRCRHPHAGRREKHPRPAPDHRVDPRRRRRRPQQHRHLPGRGHPPLAARPALRRRRLLAQTRTIPAQPCTADALFIASANGATAIISFSIASRPGGLANEQR
jgi:hypothetical protein